MPYFFISQISFFRNSSFEPSVKSVSMREKLSRKKSKTEKNIHTRRKPSAFDCIGVETIDNTEKKPVLQMQCKRKNVSQKLSKPLLNREFFVTHLKSGKGTSKNTSAIKKMVRSRIPHKNKN